MKKLDFNIPFSGFCATTFINCFASVYMYLEKIEILRDDDYFCNQRENGQCNGCGSCGKTAFPMQDKFFFLFDTMSGHSSLRRAYDGSLTDMDSLINDSDIYDGGSADNIDFLFGFAGYDYRTLADSTAFVDAVRASVDADKPVIVKLCKDCPAPFAVITGYDDGGFICPDFKNAQKYPLQAPSVGEIDAVYAFGGKIAPRFTLVDALKRIRRVMSYNAEHNLWGGFTEHMGKYGPNGLDSVDTAGKKERMAHVAATMWHTFNCHNFAEPFRQFAGGNSAVYAGVGDVCRLAAPELSGMIEKIAFPCYGYTHDLAWSLIGFEKCADWDCLGAAYFGEMVELTLSQIGKNDADVLNEINKIIDFLEA